MRTLLIAYIVIINMIGFFIMGIDKRRAIRRRWRVPEKTLFLIALLFGSIGMLIGMYVFHHKTKHLSFAIGIPAILVIQLLAISFLYSWHSQRMGSPSQAVQHELELIRELDSDTIQSFVSYENLIHSHSASNSSGSEAAEAVDLFFQNFTYSIHSESIEGNQASVHVSITNIDMQALARDLCSELQRLSAVLYPEENAEDSGNSYQLLRDTLATHTYELVVTTACFHLQKDETGWVILADDTLEDELVSGFISYMNDPCILPASQVLTIQLNALKALTAAQWADYLSIEDVFATYNTDYCQQIDDEYVRQLAEDFDYKILRCTEDGDTATATVRITSIDMSNVLTLYKKHLLAYAATTKSIRDTDVAVSNETARLLLQSLQENTQSTVTDVDLTFRNNGKTWEIYFDDAFVNAISGDMTAAIDTFNTITNQPAAEVVEPAD